MYFLHKLLWELRRDPGLATRFRDDPDAVLDGYDLAAADRAAVVARDFRTLYERGANPYLLYFCALQIGVSRADYYAQLRGGGRPVVAELSGVFATAHSPGLTGFPERAEPAKRDRVMAAFAEVARRIAEIGPEVIVAVSVEHFTNFFLANLPAFAVVTSERHLGPVTAEMGEFLQIPQRHYPGAPDLAQHIYRYALAHEFDPALVDGGFDFDENFCVPLRLLGLDGTGTVPVVPIIVNGVNPPYPTPKRCYDFGRMLRGAIEDSTATGRVVVLATGGLSHWIGMPQAGTINESFDRDFLVRLKSGDMHRLTDYDDAQLDAAGNGAHEIRTWLVAAGAAGVPFETLAYEPTPEWLTGTAVAAARMR